MMIKKENFRIGVTLIELMIAILAGIILLVGITGILAAGHKNFWTMYRRTTSDVVRNAYEAKSIFDTITRKSSIRRCDLFGLRNGSYDQIYVYYYATPNNMAITVPDRYAHFYLNVNSKQLMLEQGNVINNFSIEPPSLPTLSAATSTMPIANNISLAAGVPGIFSQYGNNGVKMVLTLDNETGSTAGNMETLKMTITSTAIRHNR
jgi:hypothetical protein